MNLNRKNIVVIVVIVALVLLTTIDRKEGFEATDLLGTKLITKPFTKKKIKRTYEVILPSGGIDAAVYNWRAKTYWFFKGEEVWKKNYGRDIEKSDWKKEWPGLPTNLDGAVFTGSKYYFFKGDKYWTKPYGKPVEQEKPLSKF
jgi:hypothetical protein